MVKNMPFRKISSGLFEVTAIAINKAEDYQSETK